MGWLWTERKKMRWALQSEERHSLEEESSVHFLACRGREGLWHRKLLSSDLGEIPPWFPSTADGKQLGCRQDGMGQICNAGRVSRIYWDLQSMLVVNRGITLQDCQWSTFHKHLVHTVVLMSLWISMSGILKTELCESNEVSTIIFWATMCSWNSRIQNNCIKNYYFLPTSKIKCLISVWVCQFSALKTLGGW